jgi:cytochrome oxidase Cu insertion factor (SCO1/SenC/PrrC family)
MDLLGFESTPGLISFRHHRKTQFMIKKSSAFCLGLLALLLVLPTALGADNPPERRDDTGLAVGEPAPRFTLKDQSSRDRSLDQLLQKGKVVALVFFRSADW